MVEMRRERDDSIGEESGFEARRVVLLSTMCMRIYARRFHLSTEGSALDCAS
jgi:hypothetical protein